MSLKLSLGGSVSVCGCLSCLSMCDPVMDWRPVQGVPRLSPDDRWDRLQPPRDPTDGLSGYRRWMDGILEFQQSDKTKEADPSHVNSLFCLMLSRTNPGS